MRFCLVNDGSRDESPRVLDQLAAASDRVRVVHLSRNFGHQAAVQAGLGPRPRRCRRADGLRPAGRPRGHRPLPRRLAGRLRRGLCPANAAKGERRQAAPLRRVPPPDGRRGLRADSGRRRHLRADRPPRRPSRFSPWAKATATSPASARGSDSGRRGSRSSGTPATTTNPACRFAACSGWPKRPCSRSPHSR